MEEDADSSMRRASSLGRREEAALGREEERTVWMGRMEGRGRGHLLDFSMVTKEGRGPKRKEDDGSVMNIFKGNVLLISTNIQKPNLLANRREIGLLCET